MKCVIGNTRCKVSRPENGEGMVSQILTFTVFEVWKHRFECFPRVWGITGGGGWRSMWQRRASCSFERGGRLFSITSLFRFSPKSSHENWEWMIARQLRAHRETSFPRSVSAAHTQQSDWCVTKHFLKQVVAPDQRTLQLCRRLPEDTV